MQEQKVSCRFEHFREGEGGLTRKGDVMFYNRHIAIVDDDDVDETPTGAIMYYEDDDTPIGLMQVPTDEEMDEVNQKTADLWSAYLSAEIYPEDVEAMLDLVEVAAEKVLG